MKLFLLTILLTVNLFHSSHQESQWTIPHIHFTSGRLHIKIQAFNHNFTLDLRQNPFLTSNYHDAIVSRNSTKTSSHNENWCHYKGNVVEANPSWAAVSYCDGKLNGAFEVEGLTYHLHQSIDDKKVKIFTNSKAPFYHCGYKSDQDAERRNRVRREAKDEWSSFNVTRYLELVIVNDFKVYTKYGKNSDFIVERSKKIVNIVNSLYSPLNILIALVGVVVWTEKNEIDITSDSSATLNSFLKYRRDVLLKMYPNDNAQLITGTSFESGIVGKALKQTLCTYEYSGGVNSDYSESISLVATTLAHELGHNFGMEHDGSGCECKGKNCIMGASSSFPSPRHWSSCSVKQIEGAFKHGIDHCLFNKPKILFRPSCGNGFIDEGEDCDCGLPESCTNPCCNATTCKFSKGAECANGLCCDRSNCKVYPSEAAHICRSAKSACDLPEKCDGQSEDCGRDLTVKDGTECLPGYAYCYAGQCNAREQQCKLLWGETGEVADYRCYQHNMNASSSGNCGFDKIRRKYLPCETQKDMICGRLHCSHRNEKLEYGPEGAAVISKSIEFRKGKLVSCYSTVIDLGLNESDPGLVPDGAKCGTNLMCVDQRCVSVSKYTLSSPCPYNCNNNGHCDNEGTCHCFDGSTSADCSGYGSRYFLTISIYILFLLILPLLTLSAFLFYNNQQRIKAWFRKKTFSSPEYHNQKRKKLPMNLQISSPVEAGRGGDHHQMTTIFSSNAHSNASTTSTVILKPIRPAPPLPPNHNPSNGVVQMSSSVPLQADQLNSLRKGSVRRPKKPPPQPPPNNPLPLVCDSSPTKKDIGVKNMIFKFENLDTH